MAQRFVETASIDNKLVRKLETKELKEKVISARLTESFKEGKITTGWEVPISRYDKENHNSRIYPKNLWERVIREQADIWRGAPCLADHPADDSDGSPRDICGVWLDARVGDDGYVYGTLAPSGSLGNDLQDHLSKGLRAGTSSSGFGDLLTDGKTVDPQTFLIERLSDWVLTPSQGTYFTYEASTQEAQNASDSSKMEESANKLENVVKEKEAMKLTKLEEKKFRKDMEIFLESADKIEDPQDQLKEYEEILSFLEEGAVPDLREAIEEKIKTKKEEIKKVLKDSKTMQEELGIKDSKDLKKKLNTIAEDTQILKEENKDWKEVAKSLQERLDKANMDLKSRPTEAYVNHLRSKINRIRAEERKQKESLDSKDATIKKANDKIEQLVLHLESKVNNTSTVVKEQRELIEKKIQEILSLKEEIKESEKEKIEVGKEFQRYIKELKEAAKPKLQKSPAEAISGHVNFREDGVDRYWADLYLRHGKEIKPFEDRIRASKTVREAMAIYMKVLPTLNESQEIDAMRIPESVSISRKERAAMLEKTGMTLEGEDIIDRLPKGWK